MMTTINDTDVADTDSHPCSILRSPRRGQQHPHFSINSEAQSHREVNLKGM